MPDGAHKLYSSALTTGRDKIEAKTRKTTEMSSRAICALYNSDIHVVIYDVSIFLHTTHFSEHNALVYC